MLSLWSLSTRVFQPHTWTRTAQSLWASSRTASSISQETKSSSQDTEMDESALARLKRDDYNAYLRWRWRNDDDYRERLLKTCTKYIRTPEGREKKKASSLIRNKKLAVASYGNKVDAQRYNESLEYRREQSLRITMTNKRWVNEGWSWKLHTPVKTPDRVDRHCTTCDRNRFLKLWWATKAEPTTYVCNSCFANNFDLMVPEGQHKKLSPVFTSPHLPAPRPNKPS